MAEPDVLARVAATMGLERRGGVVRGRLDGRLVSVELEMRGGHPTGAPPRFAGLLELPLDLGLQVARRTPQETADGMPTSPVHLGGFQMQVTALGDERERVRQLLTNLAADLTALVVGGTWFSLTDEGIRFAGSFLGVDEISAELERTADIVGRIERARAEVGVASDLAAHREAWASLAEARGLSRMDAPLAVQGSTDRSQLRLVATRIGFRRHGFELTIRLSESLRLGLSVFPRGVLEGAAGGEGLGLGSEEADRAFVARASSVEALRRVVDVEVRRSLLDMGAFAPELGDEGLTLRASSLPADPSELPRRVVQAQTLAARLRDNARALRTPSQGPYR